MEKEKKYDTEPIFKFHELTKEDFEKMPENGLYLIRCKRPEDDWASISKEDMRDVLSKQIRRYGIGNWGKDGGFCVYFVAVVDDFKETNEVSPLFILHMLYCGEGRISFEKQRREITPYKKSDRNLNGENIHHLLPNKKPHLLAV
jgi:hypothetical protein